MLKPFQPADDPVWTDLATHHRELQDTKLVDLFNADPERFDGFHRHAAGVLLDYSRQLLTHETITLLLNAARSLDVPGKIAALYAGDKVNFTEDRAALHTVLRGGHAAADIRNETAAVFSRMGEIVDAVQSGHWKGASGKAITDVVSIGIGGSHLGPMMVTRALQSHRTDGIRCHFVSNIDSDDLLAGLSGLDPRSTLFIIASKSFTTLETLRNAERARSWMQEPLQDGEGIRQHFIAVTACPDRAAAFGIAQENILPMWDYVGGRYSLWSAIGLPVALATSMSVFDRLRQGAEAMDQHFLQAPLEENLPVLLGMIGIWNVNYRDIVNHAILPYSHRLRYFPDFLQQLEMESNGKSVRQDGQIASYQTVPLVWGTEETNAQHSFHQMLHQGTLPVTADFILCLNGDRQEDPEQAWLVANALAQARVLMTGRAFEEVREECVAAGMEADQANMLARHRQMPGNRPSTLIAVERLTAETLGALIALYEHKVFVQSVVWQINAFDQFGVELGKTISERLHRRLCDGDAGERFDSATEGMIRYFRNNK